MKVFKKKKTFESGCDLRLNIVAGFFAFLFLLVIYRLFKIQVLDHKFYKALALEQYQGTEVIPAKRGEIYSSDGYILAGVRSNYLLFAEPKFIENKEEFINILTQALSEINPIEGFNQDENISFYFSHLSKKLEKELMWVSLVRGLNINQKEEIEKLELKGLGFEEEPVRFYPEGELSAHVLGFVASNEKGEPTGYYGVEGAFNEDLRGRSGRIIEETDASGMPILIGSYKKIDSIKGRSITLTINRTIQYIIEKKIKEGVLNYDAVSGSIIVMDPLTGDILGMANYPTYDPDKFYYVEKQPEEGEEPLRRSEYERVNFCISKIYEPGSVIKPFTVSSAIDLGIVSPNTTFEDNGPVQYSDYVINNWDGVHHGTQTIVELLQKSNNIGSAWVAHQVGAKDIHKYFSMFGLGSKTNVDLEGEDTGILRDFNSWTAIDLATAGFGQGISATPLQVLNAFNVIANGGNLFQPKILHSIYQDGKQSIIPVKKIDRVIKESTADTMVDMLEKAVEGGEAKFFVSKDYRIAGKTGTAQIPEEGKYAANRTNATFVGFLAGSKKFSMIVKLEEPQTSVYAAETAVPLWMETAHELVKYFGLPPDKISN